MNYIEKCIDEIRNDWFKNHIVKSIEGEEGFQRIIWGEKGTRMYQVEYILSGNMVFVTGDLGDAVYSLTCAATLENIKDFDLHYFTSKLTAHERERWDFDGRLAREQIDEYIFDWRDISHSNQLDEEEKELYEELQYATLNWNLQDHFEQAVVSIYENSSVEWFDSEAASCIAECGRRLPLSFIAYWLGLKMIIEENYKNKI